MHLPLSGITSVITTPPHPTRFSSRPWRPWCKTYWPYGKPPRDSANRRRPNWAVSVANGSQEIPQMRSHTIFPFDLDGWRSRIGRPEEISFPEDIQDSVRSVKFDIDVTPRSG